MIKVGDLVLSQKTRISSRSVRAIKKVYYLKQRRFASLGGFHNTKTFSHIIAG